MNLAHDWTTEEMDVFIKQRMGQRLPSDAEKVSQEEAMKRMEEFMRDQGARQTGHIDEGTREAVLTKGLEHINDEEDPWALWTAGAVSLLSHLTGVTTDDIRAMLSKMARGDV